MRRMAFNVGKLFGLAQRNLTSIVSIKFYRGKYAAYSKASRILEPEPENHRHIAGVVVSVDLRHGLFRPRAQRHYHTRLSARLLYERPGVFDHLCGHHLVLRSLHE